MYKTIREEFLARTNEEIDYIGIYELDWLIDDNLLDCEGIIVSFRDKKYLISSKTCGEDRYTLTYETFTEEYPCRRVNATKDEPILLLGEEDDDPPLFPHKEDEARFLRFSHGKRHILITASEERWLMVGLTSYDKEGEPIEYENHVLLNDRDI